MWGGRGEVSRKRSLVLQLVVCVIFLHLPNLYSSMNFLVHYYVDMVVCAADCRLFGKGLEAAVLGTVNHPPRSKQMFALAGLDG